MTIRLERDGAVTVLTLDRPEVLNAFNDEMGAAALDALRQVREDRSTRCLVITGAGRAFCSGEDLGALSDGYARGEAPPLGDTLLNRYNPLIREIRALHVPVVAAVNGVAAGAGASLALACDFRVAGERAKLVLAFIKVGLVPDSGAIWFLAKTIGTAAAWRLSATGDPVDAQEALRLGLFDQVVEQDAFEASWRGFAGGLAEGPTLAYALTKRLVHLAAERTLDEQLDAEVDAQSRAGATADHLEGVKAFFEKRAPRFEGR